MAWKKYFKVKVHGRKQDVGVIVELFDGQDVIRDDYLYFHMPMSEFNSLDHEEQEEVLKKVKFFDSNYKESDKELLKDHVHSRTYVILG